MGCYKPESGSSRRLMSWFNDPFFQKRRSLSSDSSVRIVLQTTDGSEAESSGASGVVAGVSGDNVVRCEWDQFSYMTCPGNSTSFLACSGLAGNTTITCPTNGVPQCGLSTPSTPWNSSSCTVISSSGDNVTCSCDVLGSLSSESGTSR